MQIIVGLQKEVPQRQFTVDALEHRESVDSPLTSTGHGYVHCGPLACWGQGEAIGVGF